MLIAYFIILSRPSSQNSRYHAAGYRPISSSSGQLSGRNSNFINNNPNTEEEFLASPEESHLRSASTNKSLAAGSENGSQLHPSRTSSQTRSQSHDDGSILSTVTTVPSIGHISRTATSPTPAPGGATLAAPWAAAPWDVNTSSPHHTEPTSINKLLAATDPDDPDFVSPFTETEIAATGGSATRRVYKTHPDEAMTLEEKFAMAKSLLVPYMVPLFLVYVA